MKKTKVLSIILVIAMIVVGCSSKIETEDKKESGKGDINSDYINLTMVKPETINPILNKDKSVGYVMNLIYDSLFTIDENYNVVPQLVKEYSIENGGKEINIKLKDAKWHDKSPVTSSDVKFTVDFIKKSEENPYSELVKNIKSVHIINDKEFNINLNENYSFSIETLIFPILSKNNLSSLSKKDITNNKNNLIGNGPYKIEKYEERDGMFLTKNEDYYKEIPSTAKDIRVGIVPDQEAQVAMVMALDSDIAKVSLNDLSKFHETEFNITKYEGRDYENIIFNYDNPILLDSNLRKAIAYSIDKKKILEEAYMGDANIVNFPLNTSSKYYNKDIKSINYNKEKAKEYLSKVKFDGDKSNSKDQKENKSNTKSNSQINLKIVVNKNNTDRVKSAHIISENLKAIGIKSEVDELEGEDLEKAISGKKYDLALVGWELSFIPDATPIIKSLDYKDEKLNDYMASLTRATSESQVKDIYDSIQKYVNNNVPMISLVIRNDYMVTNSRIEGKIQPNDFDVYEGITNLTIKNK
ncbi:MULTISPECIES: ABC transporter substrate-binding protein [Romboutsia]|uniref:ABC transporter substrate-binding protein n=1 Tax=Romboutsia TaxID=1501226 RepID=UPI001899B053|nr:MULTISPECIES: ABC transporter substrate-binding protein [Romboutsia]MCH1959318.1 ABC transporter substrate-binding protein [Romboutsia hominis]MCH1970216.1 ABC transporter substrate-binding protein [Romboutsia hominis]MDB8804118.1 ABC transporter substrate-binding protein [Romboutsia sp. 1001216sp1]MDB8807296.1 ABC transporter substrate-binding protein [Romboutsia sp. 1001216sp1]MDB8809764.1 ABC transporter substrate-binding protein [Romboutsia sp. 1001216sp1]